MWYYTMQSNDSRPVTVPLNKNIYDINRYTSLHIVEKNLLWSTLSTVSNEAMNTNTTTINHKMINWSIKKEQLRNQ